MNEIRNFLIDSYFNERSENFFGKGIKHYQICIDLRDNKVKITGDKLLYSFNMSEIIVPLENISISKKHHHKIIKKIMEYIEKSGGLKYERI